MQSTFKIGLIVKPQGLNGELKVQSLTNDINRFKNLKEVLIDDKTYRISHVSCVGDTAFVCLSGINDRNTAETFRGKFLIVDREHAVKLKENEYYIADLIDAKVFLGEKFLGIVKDVTSAKTDYITVVTDENKTVMFPFLKDLLISIDIEQSKIILNEKRFNEVACYED